MKKNVKLLGILFLIFLAIFGYQSYDYYYQDTVKIANWNLQVFGSTKASNDSLMNFYAEKIGNYDIIFIQEIRDVSGEAFVKLCGLLEGYSCEVSSRAGRSSSKEQYGVIYKNGINLYNFHDYNPDELDRWERSPIKVDFGVNSLNFTIYNIHVKPTEAKEEIGFLEDFVEDKENTMIIGDLNAACSYYNRERENHFSNWHWIIKDSDDTTSSKSYCAYDRIIMNNNFYKYFLNYGVNKEGIVEGVSDHYLIWVELRI